MQIRPATPEDLPSIQAIYALEVLEGTASFELAPPDLAEMEKRWQGVHDAGLPYVVADLDGRIGGYAYAAPYRTRPGYQLTVESTVYVARDCRRLGLGAALLDSIVRGAAAAGKRQMVAIIGDSANHGSIRVHDKAGFRRVGTLTDVGFKFGGFLDTVIMQRPLGDNMAAG